MAEILVRSSEQSPVDYSLIVEDLLTRCTGILIEVSQPDKDGNIRVYCAENAIEQVRQRLDTSVVISNLQRD